jgi:hypothetical protein
VDLATTRAQAKEAALAINRERGQQPAFTRASQTMDVAATPLNPLPPPSADRVDRLYC